ncbi:MAG: Type 1 glutamine amidotransferase-like domain-containing protein [Clostridia bacterium]|nr:Type 1 glutamine amidotransferase-like domain-containing protein [Clostridia bacterium]
MVNILMSNMSLDKKWSRIPLIKYIKPDSAVTIIGFQFYDEEINSAEQWDEFYDKQKGAFYQYLVEPLVFFGVMPKSVKWINYFKDTHNSAVHKIKNSDVLIFTDGLPARMMQILYNLDIADEIRKYKGVVIGYGSGAVIQLSDYQIEPCRFWDFGYFHGLGLVDNIGIEIHVEECDMENTSIKKFIAEKKKPLYAICDDGAVIVDNGEVSIIGDVFVKEQKSD